jgi:probable rRNA maturation factor
VLRLLRRVVRAAQLGELEVGVVFVNDFEMRALNRTWRKIDRPTDVLSFAAQDGANMPGADAVLGDLVISVDTATRQARALGHGLDVEVAALVAHGLCHLGGLDHERSAEEVQIQRAAEQTLLAIARVDPAVALADVGRVNAV